MTVKPITQEQLDAMEAAKDRVIAELLPGIIANQKAWLKANPPRLPPLKSKEQKLEETINAHLYWKRYPYESEMTDAQYWDARRWD